MSRKAVKNGGNVEEESTPEINLDQNFEEIVDTNKIQLSLSYIDRVQEFIKRNELLEAVTVYYLYKYDAAAGQSKSFISKFTEIEPPDEDAIGRKFGSGRYLVVMAISPCEKAPNGAMRAYQIKIHPFYDTLKTENTVHQNVPIQPQTTIIQPQNNFQDTLNLITQIIATISPLIQRNTAPADISSMMFKNYEVTSEVLKKNLLENVRVQSDLQRKLLKNNITEEDMSDTEIQEETGILEQLKPLLVEWLPKLLGDNAQAKVVQNLVQSTPQFKKVINNVNELKTLIAYLDNEKGKATTDKILANLKLKRV